MFHRNKEAIHICFSQHCSHHILAKISFLFLVFARLFLQVHRHSLIEQKIVPLQALKAIPSSFSCDNRTSNCTLFQANHQKTSLHTLLRRWLLRSFHTFQLQEEVSTHPVCWLCKHLRTFHPRMTENALGFFVFLILSYMGIRWRKMVPSFYTRIKPMVGNTHNLLPLLAFLEFSGLISKVLGRGVLFQGYRVCAFLCSSCFFADSANVWTASANGFKQEVCV